jgi:TrkA domain protein
LELTRTTLPGYGHIHHARTRGGHLLSVTETHDGRRELAFYAGEDLDTPVQTIRLDRDEADSLAQLLQDEPLLDRLAALEREVARLATLS